jgi:dipeptidyl aminopeptidase/acylaminoacyl peptidase
VADLHPDPTEPFRVFLDVASLVSGGEIEPHWLDDGTSFWFEQDGKALKADPIARTVEPFDPPVGDPAPEPRFLRKRFMDGLPDVYEVRSPDGRWFAGFAEDNLYVRSTADDTTLMLTSDGTPLRHWDVLGATWSPDASKIACFRVDDTDVTKMPVVHWLSTPEEVEWIVYPRVGGRIPQQELCVVTVPGGEVVTIDWRTDETQRVHHREWIPGRHELLISRMGSDHRKLTVLIADASTGSCRELVTETSETFIFGPTITMLPSGEGFIVRSERDGWAHLYRYDMDGTLQAQLTKGDFPVLQVLAVDDDWVYLTAHGEQRVYDTHLYRVRLDGTDFMRVTKDDGHHDIALSPSKRVFIDTHSTATRPPRIDVRDVDGSLLMTVSEADISRLVDAGWREPEEFVVKAADGETDLYGVLYYPRDFDPSKRYPVVESMYAGPQMTWVPRRFVPDSGRFPQALAQLGFVTFVVDGRGTPERSKAFHDVVYGNFGHSEVPDHVAVLRNLAATRPWMDLDRVGLLGGSWGGYLVLRAAILEPDVYKAIVSMYPNVDFEDHDAGLEMFMGWRHENEDRYASASCLDKVDRIKAELLLVHGTNDVNVTFSCTMKLVHALAEAMKDYELIVLPEQSHALTGTGQVYTQQRVRRFFERTLLTRNSDADARD